jgi:hypothetical protein
VFDGEKLLQEARLAKIVAIHLIGVLGLKAEETGGAVRVADAKRPVAVVVIFKRRSLFAVRNLNRDVALRLWEPGG